jgi:uncharacterized protein (TIGR04255 family)
MTRPPDLPDFADPPLHEVVLGVQFAPAQGYSQIRAGEVWSLYKDRFPHVEEHPPLPPAFETFGRPQAAQFGLGFVTGASHDRFWFLTPLREELIQFQQDRLMHNWRKVGDGKNPYPRFEGMIRDFEQELGGLEDYFNTLAPQSPAPHGLQINQCEVIYVNHFPVDQPDNWLRFVQFEEVDVDDFTMTFRRTLYRTGEPIGRLICDTGTVIVNGKLMLHMTLTARSAPPRPDMHAALELLRKNREVVVHAFAELTTSAAHKTWKRIQ